MIQRKLTKTKRKMEKLMKGTDTMPRTIFIFLAVNAFSLSISYAAPLPYDPQLEINPLWDEENTATPTITELCTRGSLCWELLSTVPVKSDENPYFLREKAKRIRLQTQQSIDREADSTDEWKHDSPLELSGFKTPSFEPKIRKKDVFTSRSWGAGGLPFSVLYLNDALNNKHKNGKTEAVTPKVSHDKITPQSFEASSSTTTPAKHPNYGIAPRNGASGKPRRRYSIIPQLFISYGWGPLGK